MGVFQSGQITPAHVRAAFAYPLIYQPVRSVPPPESRHRGAGVRGSQLGAHQLRKPLVREEGVVLEGSQIKTVVMVDILTKLQTLLLREPRNLWDAFGLLIIFPVVAHAKKELARFEGDLEWSRW